RLAIASGELRPATALPSVRQLATQLRVNPATVVQAYRDLETEGFVEMRQGAGTFVREVAPQARARERARQAVALVREMLAHAGPAPPARRAHHGLGRRGAARCGPCPGTRGIRSRAAPPRSAPERSRDARVSCGVLPDVGLAMGGATAGSVRAGGPSTVRAA